MITIRVLLLEAQKTWRMIEIFFASSVKCKLRQLWTKQALGLTVFKSADMLKNVSYKYVSKSTLTLKI